MNIKSSAILSFLSIGIIVTSYTYIGINSISAVEEVEDTSISVSLANEEVSQDNTNYVATEVLQNNDTTSSTENFGYDAIANVGTLQERIELYNYLTSSEYLSSITEKEVHENGNIGYRMSSDAEYYPKRVVKLENGETIEFIEYVDNKGNPVRLHSDGTVTPLVDKNTNQYYIDQLDDYATVLQKINQEFGTDYNFDFENSTFEEAEKSVAQYKSMTLDEFREYMTKSIKEAEKICGNAE